MFKFNMYAAMTRDNPWSQMMGGADPSDEEQDTVKVQSHWLVWSVYNHMTSSSVLVLCGFYCN